MEVIDYLLTLNEFSRPLTLLRKVKGIVMHWVENPGTDALFNRNWFENRKRGLNGYGSAHFIIDPDKIIRCIPLDEMAYHVGAKSYTPWAVENLSAYPNDCTIGIELCHPTWDGHFEPSTLEKARWLVDKLLEEYNLFPKDVCRHYDVTEKECPKYWVRNPERV